MATIYDVAKAAGVSPKTVSRVLNGDGPVNVDTRRSVEKAIVALDYVPSSAARAMRSNRSGLIGLITGAISTSASDDATGLPDLHIVKGVQKAIAAGGRTLLISDTGGAFEQVPKLIRTFLEHRVEGLIYVADRHRAVSLPPLPEGGKLVLANCYDDRGTPAVVPNDRQGQKALVARLIEHGHRRIAYLSLAIEYDASRLRTEGYREALREAGIAHDPDLVIPAHLDSLEIESQLVWDAVERLMTLAEPPTVICCGNDRMAMRLYGILRSRGLTLPEGMSVAGYDDHRIIAETLFPPLTTVALPYMAIGARAAQLLLALIDDEAAPPAEPILVSGPIAWRESVTTVPATITSLSTRRRTHP